MKYRNLSIIFMVLMIAGLISTFILTFQLIKTEKVVTSQQEQLKKSNDSLQFVVTELEESRNYLELQKGMNQKLIDSVNLICPSLSQIQNAIENELSIGLNYKSTNKLGAIVEYIDNLKYEIYYEKKDPSVSKSFVLYYNNEIKEAAEKIATDLKNKTGFDFMPLKGQSPESIKNANTSKTIIIHVNN